jgi:hypothetical protein
LLFWIVYGQLKNTVFNLSFTVEIPYKACLSGGSSRVLPPTQTSLAGQNKADREKIGGGGGISTPAVGHIYRASNGVIRGYLSFPAPRWNSIRGWLC